MLSKYFALCPMDYIDDEYEKLMKKENQKHIQKPMKRHVSSINLKTQKDKFLHLNISRLSVDYHFSSSANKNKVNWKNSKN